MAPPPRCLPYLFLQQFLPESFNDVLIRNAIRNIGENEIQLRHANQLQITASTLKQV